MEKTENDPLRETIDAAGDHLLELAKDMGVVIQITINPETPQWCRFEMVDESRAFPPALGDADTLSAAIEQASVGALEKRRLHKERQELKGRLSQIEAELYR